VNQSTLRPTVSVQPFWFTNPYYMVISHLKSFPYEFYEVILKQAAYVFRKYEAGEVEGAGALDVAKGILGKPMNDMVTREGLAAFSALLLMGPVFLVGEAMRDVIQHLGSEDPRKKGWSVLDHLRYGYVRSGVLGPVEFGSNAINDSQFGKFLFEDFLGPTFESFFGMLRAMSSSRDGSMRDWFLKQVPGASLIAPVSQAIEARF